MAEDGSGASLLRMKDKVAIVTGGCKGIGKATADIFAEHGAKVAVFDIDDEIGAAINGTQNKVGGEIVFIHCDVRDEENVKSAIQATVDKYGKIDCLVNNAGIHPPMKKIDDFTVDDFRQVFDINLLAHFITCKHALPYIRKTKGSITNISSIAGGYGQEDATTYCATKGGVLGFTRGLALDEGKRGVRVNAISPGATLTPMYEEWAKPQGDFDEIMKIASSYNILNRIGNPREIAEACLFLATGATYVTGIDLPVSGGMEVGFGRRV